MDTTSIPRYNVFTGIAKTLRILELFLLLFLLSWLLTHLRPSTDFLRRLSSFLASPLFVFAISNAIIAALVAQSSRLSTTANSSLPPREVEFIKNRKQLIMNPSESDTCNSGDDSCAAVTDSTLRKVYRRSQSETTKGNGEGGKRTARRKLRRSETEKTRYPEDKLSNEEFQRTIEAFIAKQMRFLREESVDFFVQQPNNNYNSTSLVLTANNNNSNT